MQEWQKDGSIFVFLSSQRDSLLLVQAHHDNDDRRAATWREKYVDMRRRRPLKFTGKSSKFKAACFSTRERERDGMSERERKR